MKISEEHKFQYKLAFVVFILTIISAIISGWFIVYLTSDKSPTITIYPADLDSNGTYSFTINNLKDNPANHIIVDYKFKYNENERYFLGSVPFLSKGTTSLNLDLYKVKKRVIELSEKEFSNMPLNNYKPFNVEVGDGFRYNTYKNMFNIIISAECTNCRDGDIIIYHPEITFTPKITCQHFNPVSNIKNFSCDIINYIANVPY